MELSRDTSAPALASEFRVVVDGYLAQPRAPIDPIADLFRNGDECPLWPKTSRRPEYLQLAACLPCSAHVSAPSLFTPLTSALIDAVTILASMPTP